LFFLKKGHSNDDEIFVIKVFAKFLGLMNEDICGEILKDQYEMDNLEDVYEL